MIMLYEKESNILILLYGSQFRHLVNQYLSNIKNAAQLQTIDIVILIYFYHAKEKNTARDIRELALFTKGHISQSINRLIELGYVTKVKDTKDRRYLHHILTEKAQPLIDEIAVVSHEIHEKIFAGFTEEELTLFRDMCRKIDINTRNELEWSQLR